MPTQVLTYSHVSTILPDFMYIMYITAKPLHSE